MSSNPKLKKEESIIINNDNNNNTINNTEINDSNKNIVKSEIISKTIEYQSPIGEPAEFNLNLNGEVKKNPSQERTAVCWNCQSLLIVKNGWEVVECSECHKLNRIPMNENNTIDSRISVAKSYGNLNTDIPYIYGIVVCPICETENRFRKNSVNTTCYKCGNIINLTNSNLFNDYRSNNFESNFINRSYDFSSPVRYVNTPFYPNVIQLRGLMPFPPMYQCYGNCTECTLNKILKALKKRPKNTYVPYPMYPFRYEEPQKEIRYIPINTESKKVEPDDEYKIVIRKKPKGKNSKSLGRYSSKNNAFEKVFFSKLK